MVTQSGVGGISRRSLLVGVAAVGASAMLPLEAIAAGTKRVASDSFVPSDVLTAAPRSHHTVTSLQNGNLLLAGGLLNGSTTASAILLDPSTGAYTSVAPMNSRRSRHCAVALADGQVLVMGGFNGTVLRSVEMYDPRSDQWTALPSLACARADFGVALTPGGVLICGGTGLSSSAGFELYEHLPSGLLP